MPAYISSKNFAQTLVDVICRKYEIKNSKIIHTEVGEGLLVKPDLPEDQLEKFKIALEDLPYSDLKILLTGFIKNSEQKTREYFNYHRNLVYRIHEQDYWLV